VLQRRKNLLKGCKMSLIITKNPDGVILSSKERSRGRPPVTNDKWTVEKVGDDLIVTVKAVAVAVGSTDTPTPAVEKKPVFYIYMKDGVEVGERKQKGRGKTAKGAVQNADGNWVVQVTDVAETEVQPVVEKKQVFYIYMKDGVEVSRKPKGRGKTAKGALQNTDGNWVVEVQDEAPVVTITEPVNVTPMPVVTDGPDSAIDPLAVPEPNPADDVVEVAATEPEGVSYDNSPKVSEPTSKDEAAKSRQELLQDNMNPLNWNYDFKELIASGKSVKIDALKQYTLADVRAVSREIFCKPTSDGKLVMYGVFVAGNLIDDADWTSAKGDIGWKFNSTYDKVIIDEANHAILVWSGTRDGEPKFIIKNALTTTPVVVDVVSCQGEVTKV
jgi:hypothetical protein